MFRTLLFTLSCLCMLTGSAQAKPFEFVALGDAPYGKPKKAYPRYLALIQAINRQYPAFVIHIGDTKSGQSSCDNATLDSQRRFFNRFASAAIYTPGDNEWTDCHRKRAGGFDPLERLAYIRKTYFANPARSLGQHPLSLESQAIAMGKQFGEFVENTRFMKNQVMFVQLHVVGSRNNRNPHSATAMAEFKRRNKADIAWLRDSFAKAKARGTKAVAVSFQADIFANGFPTKPLKKRSGHKAFAKNLLNEAAAYGGPVLLIYGDTHRFRIWQPFGERAKNITALEVFGAKKMHAVKVRVDPDAKTVWQFDPIYNPALAK